MQDNLRDYLATYKTVIQQKLDNYLDALEIPKQLKDSMTYSIEAGGKRLRPILLMASFEAYEDQSEKALSSAIALEMIHTYSLIHDDLPAMDDDDYRRGKLTNHKMFDESTAILAGDALLTYSFEIISQDPLLTAEQKVFVLNLLAKCSGPKGMVGGQILDILAEKNPVDLEGLETIHTLKTGELLKYAIYTGAYLANATDEQLNNLTEFAYYLGLIFQVQDDILDVTGDEEVLGKAVGSDAEKDKSTYPGLLGMDETIKIKENYVQKAKEALKQANADHSQLMALTDYFSKRNH